MKPQFEFIRRSREFSFACLEFECAVFDCPYHVHPELEILVIDSSRGRFLVGEKVGRFGPQDLFVFGGNLPHMFDSDRLPKGRRRVRARSRVIQFGLECFGAGFLELPELKKVNRFLKLALRGYVFPGGRDARLLDMFAAAHSATGAGKIAALLVLLESLASSRIAQPLASEGYLCRQRHRDSARLELAFAHINRHLQGRVTLADTARAASFSPQAFSRFFRQHIGITFQDYVIDLRLTEACRLLIESDLTVAEICFKIGFNNLSNFNRQFLARKNMSPRQYRQLTGAEPAYGDGPGYVT